MKGVRPGGLVSDENRVGGLPLCRDGIRKSIQPGTLTLYRENERIRCRLAYR